MKILAIILWLVFIIAGGFLYPFVAHPYLFGFIIGTFSEAFLQVAIRLWDR